MRQSARIQAKQGGTPGARPPGTGPKPRPPGLDPDLRTPGPRPPGTSPPRLRTQAPSPAPTPPDPTLRSPGLILRPPGFPTGAPPIGTPTGQAPPPLPPRKQTSLQSGGKRQDVRPNKSYDLKRGKVDGMLDSGSDDDDPEWDPAEIACKTMAERKLRIGGDSGNLGQGSSVPPPRAKSSGATTAAPIPKAGTSVAQNMLYIFKIRHILSLWNAGLLLNCDLNV